MLTSKLRRLLIFITIILLTAACSTFNSALYTTSHWSTLFVTRLRSPIYFSLPYGNRSLSGKDYDALRNAGSDRLLEDLGLGVEGTKDRLIMTAMSGGGARAAVFSAFVMQELEATYNERYGKDAVPFIDRMDAFSTVSGGSIYASYVAVIYMMNERGYDYVPDAVEFMRETYGFEEDSRPVAFQKLNDIYFDRYAYLGGRAGCQLYLNPSNLFLPPVAGLITDADLVDLYAMTLDSDYVFNFITQIKLGHLARRPRFFFNATNHSDFRPFLFTQSGYHNGAEMGLPPGADPDDEPSGAANFDNPLIRWHLNQPSQYVEGRPFPYAVTLEDINSSADHFPVSYSVMASAAFPGATEPVPLWHFERNAGGTFDKADVLQAADGGLFENYGITTALETYFYAREKLRAEEPSRSLKLTLLSIDSSNPKRATTSDRGCLSPHNIVGADVPVRGVTPAVTSLNKIYDEGQEVIKSILNKRAKSDPDVTLVQINLADCKELRLDEDKDVQTNYVISFGEAEVLRKCAKAVLSQEVRPGVTRAELVMGMM